MSRYNLTLKAQGAIPRDLNLGVQLKPAQVVQETKFETVTIPAPKKLLLTGPQQVGGLYAQVGSPGSAASDGAQEFFIHTTAVLPGDTPVVITSSDPSVMEPAAGNGSTHLLIGTGFYARYAFSLVIHQGGAVDITVSDPSGVWESDTITVWANALAIGQDNFDDAQAIIANFVLPSIQGYLYPVINSLFTRESGEPTHAGTDGERSIWWKIKPLSDGTLSVDTLSSPIDVDTVLAIYTGATVDALTEIASNNDASGSETRSQISDVPVTGGVVYYICVAMPNLAAGATAIRLHYALDVPSVAITGGDGGGGGGGDTVAPGMRFDWRAWSTDSGGGFEAAGGAGMSTVTQILIGGVAVDSIFITDDTFLQFYAHGGAPGTYDIEFISSGGSSIFHGAFTYT